MQTNLKLGPRAQGFDAKGELSNGLARHQIAHFFHKRIDHKPEGVTKNKLGLKRMFSAPEVWATSTRRASSDRSVWCTTTCRSSKNTIC